MALLKPLKSISSPASDVYAVEGSLGGDAGFTRLTELMGRGGLFFYDSAKKGASAGPGGVVSAGDVVLLKVNSQWDERGGTNTDLVKAVVEAILRHPDGFRGEVVIADNGQGQYGSTGRGGSLDYARNNSEDRSQSNRRVAEGFRGRARVSTCLWDEFTGRVVGEYADGDAEDGYVVSTSVSAQTGTIVSYPKFTTAYGTRVSFRFGVWLGEEAGYDSARLKVINMPVLKSHFIYGVSGCVKGYMGVPSDRLTAGLGYRTHAAVATGAMGTLLAYTRLPALNVLDAVHVNARPGTGPKTGYEEATKAGIIAAGTDPVALDSWAARQILTPLAGSVYGVEAERFDPESSKRGCLGAYLKPSADELNAAGIRAVIDAERINVHVARL